MKESFEWVIGLFTIAITIAGAVSNARKKREAEAAKKPKPAWQPAMVEVMEEDDERRLVAGWPIVMSNGVYSLEREYDAPDGREYRGGFSYEDFDAEQRYVGGEMGHAGGELRATGPKSDVNATKTAAGTGTPEAAANTPAADFPAANGKSDSLNALREVLGGDFDLRRAVIETEILTPKYA
jgi:hypothetical protein